MPCDFTSNHVSNCSNRTMARPPSSFSFCLAGHIAFSWIPTKSTRSAPGAPELPSEASFSSLMTKSTVHALTPWNDASLMWCRACSAGGLSSRFHLRTCASKAMAKRAARQYLSTRRRIVSLLVQMIPGWVTRSVRLRVPSASLMVSFTDVTVKSWSSGSLNSSRRGNSILYGEMNYGLIKVRLSS